MAHTKEIRDLTADAAPLSTDRLPKQASAGGSGSTKYTTLGDVWRYVSGGYNVTADGIATTVDLSLGSLFSILLEENTTVAFTNITEGQRFIIKVTEDGSGGRSFGYADATVNFIGPAGTINTTAAKKTALGFICTSATGDGTFDGFLIAKDT
tara:strand:- start:938 stop:1396 length:459 start_codon:yes stop_codon:yes gene_type:complete